MAVVLSALLAASCGTTAASVADNPPELWSNFRDKADSPSLPITFDSGQSAVVSSDQPSALPFVRGGAYTFAPSGPGHGASYYQTRLTGIVTRVRVRFSFIPGSTTGGRIAFAIQNSRQTGAFIPSMSAHVTVGVDDWNYGVWEGPKNANTQLNSVGYGRFDPPLVMDGVTEHVLDISIRGDTATVSIDGALMPVITDSRIGNSGYNGPYLFFECFSTVADTDNRAQFWNVEAWSEGTR